MHRERKRAVEMDTDKEKRHDQSRARAEQSRSIDRWPNRRIRSKPDCTSSPEKRSCPRWSAKERKQGNIQIRF